MMPFNFSFRLLLRKFIPQVSQEEIDRHESLYAFRNTLSQELDVVPESDIVVVDVQCYKISEDSLKKLKRAKCSDEVIEKLETMKKWDFAEKENFLKFIESVIGKEQLNKYQPEILRCAENKTQHRQDAETNREYQERINKKIKIVNDTANEIFKDFKKEFDAVQQLWIARREFALEQGNLLQIPTSLDGLKRFVGKGTNYVKIVVTTFPILRKNQVKYLLETLPFGKKLIRFPKKPNHRVPGEKSRK